MKSVYSAVRTGSLNKVVCALSLKVNTYLVLFLYKISPLSLPLLTIIESLNLECKVEFKISPNKWGFWKETTLTWHAILLRSFGKKGNEGGI
jgi:hypothetical protein